MPDREAVEEAGDVEGGGALRRPIDCREKLEHVTLEGTGEVDQGPLGVEQVAEGLAQMLEGLAERGAGFGLGRLTPEESCQRLASLRAPLEHQIGQQRHRLGADSGCDRSPLVSGEDRCSEQREGESRHALSRGEDS